MIKIIKTGGLLKSDEHGFLINESSVDKIVSPWKESVEALKSICRKQLGSAVHSVYVRGTVPRSMAIQKVSDLDAFAVVSGKESDFDFSWMDNERLTFEKNHPFLTGLELQVFFYDDLFDGDQCINQRFTIKTLSACVYGDNLAKKISPFKADVKTAQHLCGNLKAAFENTKNAISNALPQEYVLEWCRWIMKRVVRTGFLLVMARERAFTRDLYMAYTIFSKHYPSQQPGMRQALELAINPSSDPLIIHKFMDEFSPWFYGELKQQLKVSYE